MIVRWRLVAAQVMTCALVVGGVSGCRTQGDSRQKDVGGFNWMGAQSCRTLLYEFDKNAPYYTDALKAFVQQCGEQIGYTGPAGTIAKPTIEQGSTRSYVPIPDLPPGFTHEDFSGECWNTMLYAERTRAFLMSLQKEWSSRGCEREAANAQKLDIIDYPGCRAGCINIKSGCTTCRSRTRDVTGVLVGDIEGKVTCQSRVDAQHAVEDWCRYTGAKGCEAGQIECWRADVAKEFSGMSGTKLSDKIEYAVSANVLTYGKISGKVPGVVTAEGKIGVRVGADMSLSVLISGMSAPPWVERYGRREAGPYSILECSISRSTFEAYTASGSIDVGLSFIGNGASGGVEVVADARTTYSNLGSSFWLPAAGLDEEQLKGRCKVWAMSYLKTQISNTGVVTAAKNLTKVATGTTRRIKASDLAIEFEGNSAIYNATVLSVTFGERSSTIRYELAYPYWFDARSPRYEIDNALIAPFKSDIMAGKMPLARLRLFFNDVLKPSGAGSWRIKRAY